MILVFWILSLVDFFEAAEGGVFLNGKKNVMSVYFYVTCKKTLVDQSAVYKQIIITIIYHKNNRMKYAELNFFFLIISHPLLAPKSSGPNSHPRLIKPPGGAILFFLSEVEGSC